MIDTIINSLSGLAGVLIGAFLTKNFSQKSQKNDLVFNLHREFNNTEMTKHRTSADELIRKHPNLKIVELEKINIESAISLYVIMRFYQRLWIAIKYKQVTEKYVLDIFADIFYYWYYLSLRENSSPLGWWSGHELAEWFQKSLTNEMHDKLKLENQTIIENRLKSLKNSTGNTSTV